MIISASRRTDIPAFFMRWFMNRLQEGVVAVRNPFNPQQIRQIELTRETVEVIVFWTRDARNLLLHYEALEKTGIPFFVHYTITGYPQELEPYIPPLDTGLKTFSMLSERIGAGRVIWRYDPVLLSALTPPERHREVFTRIAGHLKGKTDKVVLSYLDHYAKTQKNLNRIKNLNCFDDETSRKILQDGGLAGFFVNQAAENGMECTACAEPLLKDISGIRQESCIDAGYLKQEFGILSDPRKDRNQRPLCTCISSVDIGAYNSCAFGCVYCYATHNHAKAVENRQKHHVESRFILDI